MPSRHQFDTMKLSKNLVKDNSVLLEYVSSSCFNFEYCHSLENPVGGVSSYINKTLLYFIILLDKTQMS